MKKRILLLLKLLGYSLVLFALGHRFLHAYASSLVDSLSDPRYHMPPNIDNFLYSSSLTIIAFLAITASTPKISFLKKTGLISLGISAFFLTDFFFIQYIKGEPSLTEDSIAFEIFLCMKWLLPFVLWMIPAYPRLRECFDTDKRAG